MATILQRPLLADRLNDPQTFEVLVRLLDHAESLDYAGHIDGSLIVPLESLRQRLGEISIDRPVAIYCKVGQRGYMAARLLNQAGYDATKLSGGYALRSTVATEPDVSSS